MGFGLGCSKRTFFGGTIATADLGPIETWAFAFSSPLIDLRRALMARKMSVSLLDDMCDMLLNERAMRFRFETFKQRDEG